MQRVHILKAEHGDCFILYCRSKDKGFKKNTENLIKSMADLRRHNNLVSWIQIVQSKGHRCTHLSASSWWMGQGERRLRLALALGKLSKQRAPEWFCTHHTRAMHERKPAWDCINFCQYQDSLRGNVTHFPIDRFLKNLRNAPRKKNTAFFFPSELKRLPLQHITVPVKKEFSFLFASVLCRASTAKSGCHLFTKYSFCLVSPRSHRRP